MKKNIGLILIGVAIGVGLAVAVAYILGPHETIVKMNLFTGATWQEHRRLWHEWRTEQSAADYTKWARSHMDKKRNWPAGGPTKIGQWFQLDVEQLSPQSPRNIPRLIYTTNVPEKEKVELLHEYHQKLQEISSEDPRHYKLCQRWYEKLKEEP